MTGRDSDRPMTRALGTPHLGQISPDDMREVVRFAIATSFFVVVPPVPLDGRYSLKDS